MRKLLTLLLALTTALSLRAQTWVAQSIGSSRDVNAVWVQSARTAIAVGQSGGAWRTTDGGQTWATVSTNTTRALYGVYFLDSLTGWACGENLEMRRTTNGGSSWSGFGAASGQTDLYDVAYVTSNVGWMAGEARNGFGFLYNANNNTTRQYTAAASKNLKAIYFANANNGWAVGDDGLVLKFPSSGVQWSQQTTGANWTLNDIHFANTARGVAVGDRGTIIRTTNGGSQWFNTTSPTTQALNGVYFADDTLAFAVGNSGTILRSTNGGATWVRETTGLTANLRSVHGAGPGHIWVVGDDGTVLKRTFPTAIKGWKAELELTVYPNPAQNQVTVHSEQMLRECTVYSILGERILSVRAEGQTATLDVASLKPGVYMLEAQTALGKQVRKFQKI